MQRNTQVNSTCTRLQINEGNVRRRVDTSVAVVPAVQRKTHGASTSTVSFECFPMQCVADMAEDLWLKLVVCVFVIDHAWVGHNSCRAARDHGIAGEHKLAREELRISRGGWGNVDGDDTRCVDENQSVQQRNEHKKKEADANLRRGTEAKSRMNVVMPNKPENA